MPDTCFVCGKEVSEFDDKILFGFDGDFIHKKCEAKVNEVKSRINNMSDNEFSDYLTGNDKGGK